MKPSLLYIVYHDYLMTASNVSTLITEPMATSKKIKFLPNSEVFEFDRMPHGPNSLSACVAQVGKMGEIGPLSCYFTNCPDEIHERTRDLYKGMLTEGDDIFPIITPSKAQSGLAPDDTSFPTEEQISPLKKLLETYLEANPDPYPRLAIVNTTQPYLKCILDAFLSMAREVGKPTEIKLP